MLCNIKDKIILQFVSSQGEKTYFCPAKTTEHMRSEGKTENKQCTPKEKSSKGISSL